MALSRRSIRIGMAVQYKAHGYWMRGLVHGVLYAGNPMKRANISHVVVNTAYRQREGFHPADYEPIPLEKVRTPR